MLPTTCLSCASRQQQCMDKLICSTSSLWYWQCAAKRRLEDGRRNSSILRSALWRTPWGGRGARRRAGATAAADSRQPFEEGRGGRDGLAAAGDNCSADLLPLLAAMDALATCQAAPPNASRLHSSACPCFSAGGAPPGGFFQPGACFLPHCLWRSVEGPSPSACYLSALSRSWFSKRRASPGARHIHGGMSKLPLRTTPRPSCYRQEASLFPATSRSPAAGSWPVPPRSASARSFGTPPGMAGRKGRAGRHADCLAARTISWAPAWALDTGARA